MDEFRPRWLPQNWLAGSVVLPISKWENEQFLPFRPFQLMEQLRAQAPLDFDWESFRARTEVIKTRIRIDYHKHREYVTGLYSQFDPDRDLDDRFLEGAAAQTEAPTVSDVASRELFQLIGESMVHANYRRLSPREIQLASKLVSKWGVKLKIRFSSFRRLEVYGRGDIMTRRIVRDWKRCFRKKEVEVPIYQRLAVVFRTKELQYFAEPYNPNRVHIRLFKNVPKADVDMMLPGGQVRLNWLDTGKIGIPTLWGIIMMASKLAKSLWIIALLGALKLVSGALLVVAILVATLFYGAKSVFSYGTTKRRYLLNVTKSLYYQNLDTNLGALLRLEEEGEHQEICEGILAYYILCLSKTPMSREEIDREAEALLETLTGFHIDFDVEDALRDLGGFGVIQLDEHGWSRASSTNHSSSFTND
jgi:hypothetical protein